jgi:hypothetical protein
MKAIAMKATQEDWDSVKDLIVKVEDFISFPDFDCIVTNYAGKLGVVSNVVESYAEDYGRVFYKTFDRAVLLDALDIVEEKIWKGKEMQFREKGNGEWLNCSNLREYRIKPINPEVKQLQELAKKLGYKIEKL